jgi:hypothetical protein
MRRNPARPARSTARRRNPEYDEGDYQRALAGDKNLRGANLEGANLEGADLWGADLQGANLWGAILEGADLSDTNLRGANLQGANLEAAHLAYANLAGANLAGANLEGADLEYANLSEANLEGADLTRANLEGANLADAIWGANLADAIWNATTRWPVGFSPPVPFTGEHFPFSDPTGSAAFRRWFGESVVKDETGRPVVVYHGTRRGGFTAFDPAKADAHHPGFYFTDDILMANTYVGKRHGNLQEAALGAGEGAYRLYIKMERPFIHDAEGREWDSLRVPQFPNRRKTYEVAHAVKDMGLYDGVILKNIRDSGGQTTYNEPADVYVVFDPKNIKSATANVGTYDPNDPDIRRNPRRRR